MFGIRELNSNESTVYCPGNLGSSLLGKPITDQPANFTSDYSIRTYTSGCYYLASDGGWLSDGVRVSVRKIDRNRFGRHFAHSGRSRNQSRGNRMLHNSLDHICGWLDRFTCTDQLELRFCQCRFSAKQDDLHHSDHAHRSLHRLHDLCAIQGQERCGESKDSLWRERRSF